MAHSDGDGGDDARTPATAPSEPEAASLPEEKDTAEEEIELSLGRRRDAASDDEEGGDNEAAGSGAAEDEAFLTGAPPPH